MSICLALLALTFGQQPAAPKPAKPPAVPSAAVAGARAGAVAMSAARIELQARQRAAVAKTLANRKRRQQARQEAARAPEKGQGRTLPNSGVQGYVDYQAIRRARTATPPGSGPAQPPK